MGIFPTEMVHLEIKKKGRLEGIQEGRQKGIEEGIQKGTQEGTQQGIRLTKAVLKLSAQGETPESIAKSLDIPYDMVYSILMD